MMRVVVVALAAVTAAGAWASARADDKQPLVPSITVVGSGKATAGPDMAEVQVGVVTQADSAAKALEDNNAAMDKLFKTLEARGITKKDIQTSNFSVQPQYKQPQPGQKPEVAGYQVSNQARVKVRQLDGLGRILDEVVAQGANQVQAVTFSVAEPDPVLDEARGKAMAEAHRKAELYAKAAGVEVGRVLLIQEETPRLPGPLFMGMGRGASDGAVPVAPGEQEFQASVTVTYAIGPGMAPPIGPPGGMRGPSPKGQLAQLVAKLDVLTDKPLSVQLTADQRKQIQEQLNGLADAKELSDEDAKAKLDKILDVLKSQKETLEAAGYRWPAAGGPSGPPPARPPEPPPNPFTTDANAGHLKSLSERLEKGGNG